jgi:diphthamide synthase (EF-2-diphthine--ammonia ligase)
LKSAVLSWSGGKDCAWCLRVSPFPIAALLTTFDETTGRIPIHDVPLDCIEAQADALRIPLRKVALPAACPNEEYRARVAAALRPGEAVMFGDLFLQDVREFRERSFPDWELVFPLWGLDTAALAGEMVREGLEATVTAVDTRVLPASLVGSAFDQEFLSALPAGVDPCGENGEFHTFVSESWLASSR